jgi:hypothetical protein
MAVKLTPTGLITPVELSLTDYPQIAGYGQICSIYKNSVPASTNTVMCRIDNCRGLIQVASANGTQQKEIRWFRVSTADSPNNHPASWAEETAWHMDVWNNGSLAVSFNNNSGNDTELIVNTVSYYGNTSMQVVVSYFGGL